MKDSGQIIVRIFLRNSTRQLQFRLLPKLQLSWLLAGLLSCQLSLLSIKQRFRLLSRLMPKQLLGLLSQSLYRLLSSLLSRLMPRFLSKLLSNVQLTVLKSFRLTAAASYNVRRSRRRMPTSLSFSLSFSTFAEILALLIPLFRYCSLLQLLF